MKKIKRFFTIIIFLGILGGGFYFGWIQYDLEENQYAVTFSKISGYSTEVLEPGKFIWKLEKLIPKNMKVHIFDLNPRQAEISLQGTLPSGEVYSEVLDSSPSFDYIFKFNLTYRLKPDHLPELALDGFLTPENLDQWYAQFEDNCVLKASEFLQNQADKPEFYGLNSNVSTLAEDKLKNHLEELFPHIDFMSVIPSRISMPDAELYQAGKDEYFSLMDARHEINLEALREASQRTMNETANLDLLSKYGELLTTYPILIEYLDKNPVLSEELIMSLQSER